jgi:hypothetical protein
LKDNKIAVGFFIVFYSCQIAFSLKFLLGAIFIIHTLWQLWLKILEADRLVWSPDVSPTSCVALGNLFNLSVLHRAVELIKCGKAYSVVRIDSGLCCVVSNYY